MAVTGKQIFSTLADGKPTVEVLETSFAEPTGNQVLVEMEAAPINPYKSKVSLDDMLIREAVLDYREMRTGEKYLVTPNAWPQYRCDQGLFCESVGKDRWPDPCASGKRRKLIKAFTNWRISSISRASSAGNVPGQPMTRGFCARPGSFH